VPEAEAPPIAFPGVLVIVGGGTLDTALLRQLRADGAALVGADGGGDAIAEAGFVPEAIIGDMDSLDDPESWIDVTRLLRISEQETTDFEKALYSTTAPVTVALGMTGKRLDHTLAALSAVLRYAPDRRLMLVDEVDVAFAAVGPFTFTAAAGERVSIHPLAPISFLSSVGLKYSLNGLRLEPGGLIGTSNEGEGGTIEIVPTESSSQTPWLLILDKSRLWDLLGILS
jgi:thiamine pyrophosphokinase